MNKRKYIEKLFFVSVCSATLFLNQNCGGDGFAAGNLLSRNHSPSDIGEANKASYSARLGDRFYVASVLASIFFPEGSGNSNYSKMDDIHSSLRDYVSSDFTDADLNIHEILADNIIENIEEFKGPCSAYEKDGSCDGRNPANIEIDTVGSNSVSKEGIRVSVCYQILDQDRAVQNVMNRVSKNYNTSRMDADKIQDTFNLFYPGQRLDVETLNPLSALAEDTLERTKTNLEAWRMVLLSICQSGTWQIP